MKNSNGRQLLVLNRNAPRGDFTHALFDFDGTISLIREGWQQVMIPMFVEILTGLQTGESPDELTAIVREWVARLTGKQTIYQMLELCGQVRKRGGMPADPLEYKRHYLARLDRRIQSRIEALRSGGESPERFLVPGAIEMLKGLQNRGIKLFLASGTDEPFVLREAELLGVAGFFEGGIFGAIDNYQAFSKKLVIDRILTENHLRGPELVSIGDGFVEIENARQVGAFTLGVASCESNPVTFDEWKVERLKEAGANVLVPHFAGHEAILQYLFDPEE